MPGIARRAHIVPASLDYDRIRRALEDFAADHVYILHNINPIESHEEINEDVIEEVRGIVREHTRCYDTDDVNEIGIDFYRFESAMIEIYRILFKEELNNNEVIVNISGGSKPVAIAAAFACSLTGIGTPIYYTAEEYGRKGEQVISYGVGPSFEVSPLRPLDLENRIPSDSEKREILLALRKSSGSLGMRDVMVSMGIIQEQAEDRDSDERQRLIQKYHRHGRKMIEENILEKRDSEYTLTPNGELISELIQVQEEVK